MLRFTIRRLLLMVPVLFGLSVLLFSTGENRQHEQRTFRLLAERPVDGIIACASRLDAQDLVALHERHQTPMVVINRRLDHPAIVPIFDGS